MKNADAVEQLRAELQQDYDIIALNYSKNREMTERIAASEDRGEYEYAALGYTLHNLYNALEAYFLRVAKFFENNLDESEWHRSLVRRMTLEISGVRPALFDREFALRIDELMRFRHRFRNLYQAPLIPEKVDFANRSAEGLLDEFRGYHEAFDSFLRELKVDLEG
ncbi:MAG: hypothetical protein ACLFM0_11165 [Spirochaetales bacterium]